ncbi:hypothetical protein HYU15_04400, partial [Candidatus Woesearchaeota archaeon]|nr:hypothetical protein [Candidatus Woesearchaeota archaeon]
TIKADTALVGGPSAGAAAAVLTAAILQGDKIDESIAMTGTINSGGLVGPVGGLKEKIAAAQKRGIRKVLIPEGERYIKPDRLGNLTNASSRSDMNSTIDLVEVGKNAGVEVVEVSDLMAALGEFTGKSFGEAPESPAIDKSYSDTMEYLANLLCNKSASMDSSLPGRENFSGDVKEVYDSAVNLSRKGIDALNKRQFYSSASYCFGANVRYRYLDFDLRNFSGKEIIDAAGEIRKDAYELEKSVPDYVTITDLQSYASVRERLLDAEDNINISLQRLSQNRTSEALFALAYAKERVFSAYSWSQFFGKEGKRFIIDREALEASCRSKISEAEERYEYARLFMDGSLSNTRRDIDRAYDDLSDGNYELCLSKAAKAKAESDVLLSTLGVEGEGVDALVARKLLAAGRVISRQASKGVFPIVGYSYYEYANSLNDSDPYSALLYAEYAIELSNMDMYFRKSAKPEQAVKGILLPSVNYASFALGAMAGASFMLIVLSAVFAVRRFSARKQVIKRKRLIVKKAAVRRKS